MGNKQSERLMSTDDGDLSPAELAFVCEALIAAWHHDAAASAGGATPGSQAALDLAAVRKLFPDRTPASFEHAHEQMSGQMIDAIVLLLQSVSTQLRARQVITVSLWPLVRAEFEHAGRVAWLLEPFSDEDAGGRRMARALLEQLSAAQRQRFTNGKWNPARAKQFKTNRDELLDKIRILFDDVYTPMDRPEQIDKWRIGGEVMAPLGKAIELFLKRNFSNGDAIYHILSDYSHPSVISLALHSSASDEDGVTIWSYPPIPRVINFQARLACAALHNIALAILQYFGYPSIAIDRWASEAPPHWFGLKSV